MIDTMYNMAHADLAGLMSADGLKADALIVDAPYSAKTHSSYDSIATRTGRCEINYAPWTEGYVNEFVALWSPLTSGWLVTITDHELMPIWSRALLNAGRYVFAPLPLVELGSRVRLNGDGPSSWTCWIVVARPRTPKFVKWGTLPGAYVQGSETKAVIGGKPLQSMRALVRDYSRPGELVCDPCAGAGTTLLAAKLEDRAWIGCDIDENHTRIARGRLADMPIEDLKKTLPLFGTGENK